MELKISKIFIRTGNQSNVSIIQLLNKKCSTRSLCNVTNIPKSYKNKVKPNLFGKEKFKNVKNLASNISVSGYLLLSIPIATFILGTWQVQRRKWKLDLIEKLNNRICQKPIELPESLGELESMEYYPIKVKGTFLYEKEFIVGFRSLLVDGKSSNDTTFMKNAGNQIGYHIITPFKLADRDLTILVNRGWIPKSYKNIVRKQKSDADDEIEITGILRLNETRPQFVPKNSPQSDVWHYRDLNEMAKIADADPVYIEMIYNMNAPEYPVGGQTQVQLRNEHTSYIITWYSLSIITAYMWYKKFIKNRIVL
nr:PREDICTED: surfeit locus protein 1 [Megachile rotundata]